MKTPIGFRSPFRSFIPQIESDTPIVPRAVMEAFARKPASGWAGRCRGRGVRELTARANTVYARNPYFRRIVCATGDNRRDYLWAFTRHWPSGLMRKRRPQLHARLPNAYSVGHPLPPKPFKTHRKIPPPGRLRPRPVSNYAVAAAAHFHFP